MKALYISILRYDYNIFWHDVGFPTRAATNVRRLEGGTRLGDREEVRAMPREVSTVSTKKEHCLP